MTLNRWSILVAFVAAQALFASPGASQTPSNALRPSASSLKFTGYVVDQANLLDARQRRELTDILGRFQQNTKHQLAVVTVTSLSGEDVSVFTRALANRWGVGRRGANDGIVLLVAPNERKSRIAVGRGLEGRLTDPFCESIMSTQMVPAFKAGQFAKGINAGVRAIIKKLVATER